MPSVALDIGHGKNTFPPSKGVYVNGRGYAEHDFNSRLGIEIEKHLKRNGIIVAKIQEPFANEVPLTTRTDFYNRRGVDLVWSLHANYSGDKNAKGICAFYWHDHANSKKAAEFFVEELKKAGFATHGNGLHASMTGSWTNLHIVRETKMTAVLTENDFMSNPKAFENIFGKKQSEYIARLAVVHAKAICRYFNITYKGEVTVAAKRDVNKVSPWAATIWEDMSSEDRAYYDGTRPGAYVKREEDAVVLYRVLANLEEYRFKPLEDEVEKLKKEIKEIRNK
jgi:N-acetylmuramoyl-L-alanine amidase